MSAMGTAVWPAASRDHRRTICWPADGFCSALAQVFCAAEMIAHDNSRPRRLVIERSVDRICLGILGEVSSNWVERCIDRDELWCKAVGRAEHFYQSKVTLLRQEAV